MDSGEPQDLWSSVFFNDFAMNSAVYFSNYDLHKILAYLNMLPMPEENSKPQFETRYMLELLVRQYRIIESLGPVVQSIISLTSLLRGQLVKYFTTL